MAYSLNSIDEAVDGKFLITKNVSNQAQAGTLVHIMDSSQSSSGVSVNYRVTNTGQNFTIKFGSLKDFCKWATPDTFIARYYESFTKSEILNYIKVNERTFLTFAVPIIAVALVIIWVLCLLIFKDHTVLKIILGIILSLVAAGAVTIFYKRQKTQVKLKLYKKVSSNWACGGIAFK
ncbi:MAG: hypothetical protein II773_09675 [Oscillospiraceae bacterium]|nr:hypothetical protein [Oscillospiraceae bacterium]MCR5167469.1 hypothetical protein [Oscillospiraceae bacterium]